MFYLYLLIITVVLLALAYLLPGLVAAPVVHPNAHLFIVFFALLTAFTYRLVKNGFDRDPNNFVNPFMASVVIRLMVSLGFFLVYLLLYSKPSLLLAFTFIGLYFLYTGFEIYYIVRNLRPFSKNPRSDAPNN